ncbi:Crp/Fnr family transcriptional regulator [Caldovatus aquaticus]|uniref:Crp/Fnr family transcriptional regulator n=1 Tax=Caldovatus aquaticus TaxID=2865671 RepID=A0ABS7F4G5_9PROT|nr:Crp/Fnr family transcriptional regulator [Caldovatus aquaticus]MBW8270464.1 Crp/Fnr family transcriptional regulator [Caldovatus aquaticus]
MSSPAPRSAAPVTSAAATIAPDGAASARAAGSSTAQWLARFPLFAEADRAALGRAAAEARWIEVEPDQMVLDFDHACTDLFLVDRGALRVLLRAPGGREAILDEIGPGSFFGEMAAIGGAAPPPAAGVRALLRSRLCVLPADAFLAILAASPAVSLRLLRLFTARVRAQNARLLERSALPVRHRLYAELLRLSRPAPGNAERIVVSPPPARRDLAARIGARREAVSRELADLARRGLVEVGRRALVLRDPAALRQAVETALAEARAGG